MLKNPFKKKDKRTKLEKERDRVLDSMQFQEKGSVEFTNSKEYLEILNDAVAEEKPKKISKDTLLIVGANLLIALGILISEQDGPTFRSKASNFITKGRV